MIRRIPARHSRQLFTTELTDRPPERRGGDDAVKLPMIRGDGGPNGVQLVRAGHVDAAAHPDPLRRDFDVESGTLAFRELPRRKMRGHVRLERAFVAAEAR